MTWFDWANEYLTRWKAAQIRPSEIGNFTPRACKSIALARGEAQRLHHDFLGTEHLLLGIIKLRQGIAVNALRKLGLDLETIRTELEQQISVSPSDVSTDNTPFTPRMKKVLSLAQKNAKAMNHTYVGPEHLLLGLLEEGGGLAAKVLKQFKTSLSAVRQEILKELDPTFYFPGDDNQDQTK